MILLEYDQLVTGRMSTCCDSNQRPAAEPSWGLPPKVFRVCICQDWVFIELLCEIQTKRLISDQLIS